VFRPRLVFGIACAHVVGSVAADLVESCRVQLAYNDPIFPGIFDDPKLLILAPARWWRNLSNPMSVGWRMVEVLVYLLLVAAIATFVVRRSQSRIRQLSMTHVCRRCGYDLRATPDRCPECGTIAAVVGKNELSR
jgi:hypothetical protein